MKLPSYGNAVLGIARAINDEIAEILQEEKGKDPMREELAALIHDMWSGWIGHVASKSTLNPDGSMTIPAWAVRRRERQMKGSYNDLSEKEKNSDRREADKVLALIEKRVWEHDPGKLIDLPLFQSYQADR